MIAGIAAAGSLYHTKRSGTKPVQTTEAGPSKANPVVNHGAEVKRALVKISSEPEGAAIYVDSIFVGKSPMDLELSLGKHELRLSLNDYLAWEAQVEIDTPGDMPLHITLMKE